MSAKPLQVQNFKQGKVLLIKKFFFSYEIAYFSRGCDDQKHYVCILFTHKIMRWGRFTP